MSRHWCKRRRNRCKHSENGTNPCLSKNERPPPVSSVRYVYVSRMCVSVCGSQRARGELYSTLRYIGKPEKFPSGVGWGVGVRGLKREHRFAVNRKTDHMLLQSRPSAHLPVSSVTVTLPPRFVACEYTALLHYRQSFKFELVYTADGDGEGETLTMLYNNIFAIFELGIRFIIH